jgi:SAM-dependent methyltransferase
MLLIIIIIVVVFLSSFAFAGLSLIIWLPTKSKDLNRILNLAQLKPEELFYDLGCGDGKVVMYLGKRTQAKVIGLELAWPLYLACKTKQLLAQQKNINFKLQNLFTTNLAKADVIYIFGIPEKLKDRLRPKFEQELQPGSRVISYAFKIAGWQPTLINRPIPTDVPIYFYQR